MKGIILNTSGICIYDNCGIILIKMYVLTLVTFPHYVEQNADITPLICF